MFLICTYERYRRQTSNPESAMLVPFTFQENGGIDLETKLAIVLTKIVFAVSLQNNE